MSKKILTLDNVPVINKKIGKIDTIEKLKASTIYSIGDVVEVLGFHAKGDGSHHKRIAKAEDDGSGELGQGGIWWCIVHSGEVNVSWFGAEEGKDITSLLQNIFALTSIKRYVFPKQTYKIDFVDLHRNDDVELIGTNTKFIFTPHREKLKVPEYGDVNPRYSYARAGNYWSDGLIDIRSSEATLNIKISGFTFESDVVSMKFDELVHHIHSYGANFLEVTNCKFVGFLGDGIAVSDGKNNSDHKKLKNGTVWIHNNFFDGINCDNRQGVSVYRAESTVIERNEFYNLTRKDMPGAIDFESDSGDVFPTKTLSVRNNIIKNCNCGVGAISLVVGLGLKSALIEGNHIEDANSSIGLIGSFFGQTPKLVGTALEIRNNTAINTKVQLFNIKNIYSAILENNSFEGFTFNDVSAIGVVKLSLINNYFNPKQANANGLILRVDGGEEHQQELILSRNTFTETSNTNVSLTAQAKPRLTMVENNLGGKLIVPVRDYSNPLTYLNIKGNQFNGSGQTNYNDTLYCLEANSKPMLSKSPTEFYRGEFRIYRVSGAFPESYLGSNVGILKVSVVSDYIVQEFITSETNSSYKRGCFLRSSSVWTNWVKTTGSSLATTLDTPYYTLKMQQEGMYEDYVAYRDELHEYENSQTTDETMLLPVLHEPIIPESVKQFAEKYKLI